MRKIALIAMMLACVALPSCAAQVERPGSPSTGVKLPTLEQLEDGYATAQRFATMLLPYVSPARAARIQLALDLAGRALAKARTASDAARGAELLKAQAAQQQLDVAIDAT